MVGALMVDGYGDGLVIECASEDVDFLRTTGFGLLQVRIEKGGWRKAGWAPCSTITWEGWERVTGQCCFGLQRAQHPR